MAHTIINEDGMFIDDKHVIAEVSHITRYGLDHSFVDGKLIRITRDERVDGNRTTTIQIEGL